MRFEEMMKKYIAGQLSDEEAEYMENEIEKHEAISEYLYEDAVRDKDFIKPEQEERKDEQEDIIRLINKAIRRAFMKMGAVVLAITLAVVMFCMFGLSPLVAAFYYNPGKEIGEFTNQMSLDWAIYSELTMPGARRDDVSVEDKGFGKYNITIHDTFFNATLEKPLDVSGEIDKGALNLYNKNALKKPASNLFTDMGKLGIMTMDENDEPKMQGGKENPLTKEEVERVTKSLSDGTYYRVYVSFKEDLEFDKLTEFLMAVPIRNPEWIGIRVQEGQNANLGYAINQGGIKLAGWDEEKYPNLIAFTATGRETIDENWCKTHFQSMLKYMADREDFRKLVGEKADYKAMEQYVEEHGLNCYGMVVQADKEEIVEIAEYEGIKGLYVEPLQ